MFCPQCLEQYDGGRAFCPEDGAKLTSNVSYSAFRPSDTGMTGAVLGGRYKVRGFVNKGATARVYLAEDTTTQEPVAVKLLTSGTLHDEEARTRFLREARAAASIDHPNVVKILGAGESGAGVPYIVMEVLLGEPLGDFVRREGPMAPDLALTLVRQAASGLAAAHAAGVIHRDVKPDNLFLVGDPGEPFGLKVIDFGLAKIQDASTKSVAGLVLGTIEYMAPEQILTDRVDAGTDVYGLGVTMFRMFTGQLPFDVEKSVDVLAHQLLSPAPPPSWLVPGLDPRIDAIILTAMRKRPENRYPSMSALLEDVEMILGVRPGTPTLRPLLREPDVYEPETSIGRDAVSALSAKLGITR